MRFLADDARGYRYGAILFGAATLGSLIAVAIGSYRSGSGMLSGFRAVMGQPMGLRLCLMTSIASIACLGGTLLSLFLATDERFRHGRASIVIRGVIAVLIVGVIDIITVYAAGFLGYIGPLVLLSWLAVALLVSMMNAPGRAAFILAVPLTVMGFGAAAILSMTLGIPWD